MQCPCGGSFEPREIHQGAPGIEYQRVKCRSCGVIGVIRRELITINPGPGEGAEALARLCAENPPQEDPTTSAS